MISLFDQMRKKHLLRQYLLFFSAVIIFHSIIYYPVYLFLASNIIWKNSIFFFLWTEIAEPLSVYLFFWGSFAYLIYAGIRHSKRSLLPFLIVYSVGAFLRYALQNVCFIIMMGWTSWRRSVSFLELLWNLLLDLLIMGVVFLLLYLLLSRLEKSGESAEATLLPLGGFFDLKNALIKLSLASAAIPCLARIITRAGYDIRMILLEGITPSGPAEILLMVTYYLTDAITVLLGYLVIYVIVSSLYLSDVKAKMRFDAK